jgi:hypothetical protein
LQKVFLEGTDMKHEKNHMDDLQEWQENQFNPGYYVGNGKIPPYIKAEGNPILASIPFFVGGLGMFAGFVLLIIFRKNCFLDPSDYSTQIIAYVFALIITFCFSALFILAGINYIRKKNDQNTIAYKHATAYKKRKKKSN